MRSAGCIVNDIFDRDLDRKVSRTKNRPIASKKISVKLGLIYATFLCLIALIVLLNFNTLTIVLALGSMPLAFSYPLMKRYTYWPQLFLGITFNYGLILGWTCIKNELDIVPLIFYLGAIFWTLGFDTRLNGIAVDAVFDSVSVATTFKEELTKKGIIFCSISEAIQKHPDLVKKYLGSVIPLSDHYFATLNSAVFTDGSFVYIPPNTRCPMELSTYFRINASETGQFERTLIIADKGSYVSYLEGCTAPMRDENQLHAANVELIALDDAEIKYSTVQNWYPGDKNGVGGIYNFVTKRGACRGKNSKISWTQVETGSAITWKYPSCILQGDNSVGEFYSIAITNNYQKADTGTKMIHLRKEH